MLTMLRGASPLAFCLAVAVAGLGFVCATEDQEDRQVVLFGLSGWSNVDKFEFKFEDAGTKQDDVERYSAVYTEIVFDRSTPWAYRLPAARVGDTLHLKAVVGGKAVKMKHLVPNVAVHKHAALSTDLWTRAGMPSVLVATTGIRHEDLWAHMLDIHVKPAVRSGKSEKEVAAAFTKWWRHAIAAHRGWSVAIMAHGFQKELEGKAVHFKYEVKDSKHGEPARLTQRDIEEGGAIFAGWTAPSAAGTATVTVEGAQGSVDVAGQGVHVVNLAGGAKVLLVVHRSHRAMAKFQEKVRADKSEVFWTERTASWNEENLSELWKDLHPERGEGVSSDEFADAGADGEEAEEKTWMEFCEDPMVWIGIPVGFLVIGLAFIYCCRPSDAEQKRAAKTVQLTGHTRRGPPMGSVARGLPDLNTPLGEASAPLTAADHGDGPVRMMEPPSVASFTVGQEAAAAVASENEGASQGSVVKHVSFASVSSTSEISREEEEENPQRDQEDPPPATSRIRVLSSGRVGQDSPSSLNRSLTEKVKEVIARVSWRGESFPPGMLAYGGQPIIDPTPEADEEAKASEDIETETNFVAEALDELLCGAPAPVGDDHGAPAPVGGHHGAEAVAGVVDGEFHVV